MVQCGNWYSGPWSLGRYVRYSDDVDEWSSTECHSPAMKDQRIRIIIKIQWRRWYCGQRVPAPTLPLAVLTFIPSPFSLFWDFLELFYEHLPVSMSKRQQFLRTVSKSRETQPLHRPVATPLDMCTAQAVDAIHLSRFSLKYCHCSGVTRGRVGRTDPGDTLQGVTPEGNKFLWVTKNSGETRSDR